MIDLFFRFSFNFSNNFHLFGNCPLDLQGANLILPSSQSELGQEGPRGTPDPS